MLLLVFREVSGWRFLGPNGAGKTTLIRCLAGLTNADQGEIFLAGRPFQKLRGKDDRLVLYRKRSLLYADLTTRQNLEAFGRFHGLRRRALRDRLAWAMQWTGLEDRAERFGWFFFWRDADAV